MASNDADYSVVYRDIKHPRLEFKKGSLLVVLPKGGEQPQLILDKHRKWIAEKQKIITEALQQTNNKNLNIKRTDEELKQLVSQLLQNAQSSLNTTVKELYFRKMNSKWASYSKNSNLTVNLLLKYLPVQLIKYVIFHEVTHSLGRKHNAYFWGIIARQFPNYLAKEEELLIYWFLVQRFISEYEQ